MVKTTRLQRVALKRVYMRIVRESDASLRYQSFRRTVQPGPGCVMVPFAGMWLGIEPDGYTHS